MEMTGERRIAASRTIVWDALNDPEILKQCIPGCEALEMKSPTEMAARVKVQIGPVKATFNGKVMLSDLDPPNGYRIAGEGTGGVAGFAKGGAVVRLVEHGAGTLMTYEVKASVGGKLAQLGSRLIDSTARKLADEFFGKFTATVGEAPSDEISPRPGEGAANAASSAPADIAAAAEPPTAASAKKPGWFGRMFKGKAQTEH
jgi:carbon monoxide dehydrogenase subunit G